MNVFLNKKSIIKTKFLNKILNYIIINKSNYNKTKKNIMFWYMHPIYDLCKTKINHNKTKNKLFNHDKLYINKKYNCIYNIFSDETNNKLYKFLHNNKKELLEELQDIINKYQKIYFGLIKFKHLIYEKTKKYILYDCDYDIKMNDFNEIDSKYILHLKENNTIYRFNIQNMRFIMKNCLYSNEYMVVKPKQIKNPYTNQNITTYNLYKIYVKMRETNIPIPHYISLYYKINFDLNLYKLINSYELEKYATHYFTYYSDNNIILDYMFDMFDYAFYNKISKYLVLEPECKYNELDENKVKIIIEKTKDILFEYLLATNLSSKVSSEYHLNNFKNKYNDYFISNKQFIVDLFECVIKNNNIINENNPNTENSNINFNIGFNINRYNRNNNRIYNRLNNRNNRHNIINRNIDNIMRINNRTRLIENNIINEILVSNIA